MAVDLAMAKKFLRVDFDYDDAYIQLLLNNAEEYLRDTIDDYDTKISIDRFTKKADLLTLVLVQDWYDNREMITKSYEKVSERVRYTIQSIIVQMQYCNYTEVL